MTRIIRDKKMKSYLPKKSSGFTLIELIVAISIVAILSVVGFSVFSNTQKNARDSKRMTEIDALTKAIESTWDPSANKYSYTVAQFNADFPTNTTRPYDSVSGRAYCVRTSATPITPPAPNAAVTLTATGCQTGYSVFTNSSGIVPNATDATQSLIWGNPYWVVCAYKEVNNYPICKTSLH